MNLQRFTRWFRNTIRPGVPAQPPITSEVASLQQRQRRLLQAIRAARSESLAADPEALRRHAYDR